MRMLDRAPDHCVSTYTIIAVAICRVQRGQQASCARQTTRDDIQTTFGAKLKLFQNIGAVSKWQLPSENLFDNLEQLKRLVRRHSRLQYRRCRDDLLGRSCVQA